MDTEAPATPTSHPRTHEVTSAGGDTSTGDRPASSQNSGPRNPTYDRATKNEGNDTTDIMHEILPPTGVLESQYMARLGSATEKKLRREIHRTSLLLLSQFLHGHDPRTLASSPGHTWTPERRCRCVAMAAARTKSLLPALTSMAAKAWRYWV
jgi:hypothetical protein